MNLRRSNSNAHYAHANVVVSLLSTNKHFVGRSFIVILLTRSRSTPAQRQPVGRKSHQSFRKVRPCLKLEWTDTNSIISHFSHLVQLLYR
eukprot:jgi/Psemu1/302458/fgenesh1_kg.70_\